jgi:hypothetical protein
MGYIKAHLLATTEARGAAEGQYGCRQPPTQGRGVLSRGFANYRYTSRRTTHFA